tara:strand:- start:515 stop:2086 length:1572 start_codon:yes stop_codon:yes gene_type:complete
MTFSGFARGAAKGAARGARSSVDEVIEAGGRGIRTGLSYIDEQIEAWARTGKYDPLELERVRGALENGETGASTVPKPKVHGDDNGSLIIGDQHKTQTPARYNEEVIEAANKHSTSSIINEPEITTTDQVGYDWYKPGGGLDEALDDLLTVKKKHGKWKKGDKKTYEDLTKTEKDYYDSLVATGPQRDAFDTIEYLPNVEKPRSSLSILETLGDQRYKASFHKSLEFHHKGMKAIEARIYKRALKLLRDGKATEADLVRLNNLGYDMGIPTGSRKSAGLYMNRMPHQVLHQELMLKDPNFPHSPGLQPSGTPNVPALRSKPKQFTDAIWKQLKKIDEDFTSFDRDWILERAGKPVKGKYPNLQQAVKKWIAFRQSTAYDFFAVQRLSDLDKLAAKADNMDINQLIDFQEQIFRDISQPMTKEGGLLEEVWGRMGLEEQVGSFDDAGAGLLRQRNELVDRRADIAEVMEQRKIESFDEPVAQQQKGLEGQGPVLPLITSKNKETVKNFISASQKAKKTAKQLRK